MTSAARIAGGVRAAWCSSSPSAVTRTSPAPGGTGCWSVIGCSSRCRAADAGTSTAGGSALVAMELKQLDVTASLFLADGRECKIITGIDGSFRFCVIATVVLARDCPRGVLRVHGLDAGYGVP